MRTARLSKNGSRNWKINPLRFQSVSVNQGVSRTWPETSDMMSKSQSGPVIRRRVARAQSHCGETAHANRDGFWNDARYGTTEQVGGDMTSLFEYLTRGGYVMIPVGLASIIALASTSILAGWRGWGGWCTFTMGRIHHESARASAR